ncbi:MAG: hypothetical protein ABJA82_01925 [Myxococcales bacterium]
MKTLVGERRTLLWLTPRFKKFRDLGDPYEVGALPAITSGDTMQFKALYPIDKASFLAIMEDGTLAKLQADHQAGGYILQDMRVQEQRAGRTKEELAAQRAADLEKLAKVNEFLST